MAAAVARALDARTSVATRGTDAYRLLFGEGDGFPGITVDRYGRFAVAKTYADGYRRPGSDAHELLAQVVRALAGALRLKGVLAAPHDGAPLTPLHGELPPPEVTVHEHGLAFLANLHEGQKTGLFLDHRDNRATVRRWSAGRTVANLFAYSGAFSVHALAGGARRAVDVDVAPAALRDAERNAAVNLGRFPDGTDVDPRGRHATLALDLLADPASALRHAELVGAT